MMYTSQQILETEELYELQDSFSSSGIPFKYQLTEGEYEWAKFIKNKYAISDYVLDNTDNNKIMSFDCPNEMYKALLEDGIPHKAVMLSDDSALQKLFFWLSNND